jgi:hypothetical protein
MKRVVRKPAGQRTKPAGKRPRPADDFVLDVFQQINACDAYLRGYDAWMAEHPECTEERADVARAKRETRQLWQRLMWYLMMPEDVDIVF